MPVLVTCMKVSVGVILVESECANTHLGIVIVLGISIAWFDIF